MTIVRFIKVNQFYHIPWIIGKALLKEKNPELVGLLDMMQSHMVCTGYSERR